MCLAAPGRIVAITDVEGGVVGRVELGTVVRDVNLMLVPEARVGDFVVTHSGIAVRRLSADEAVQALELWQEEAAPSES